MRTGSARISRAAIRGGDDAGMVLSDDVRTELSAIPIPIRRSDRWTRSRAPISPVFATRRRNDELLIASRYNSPDE